MNNVIDITAWINSVHREIRRDTEPRRVILRRRFDTDLEDLWEALTTPERVARWFATVEGTPALGNTLVVTALGSTINWTAEVRRCEAPRNFVITWNFNGENCNHDDCGDEVEVRLTPDGDGTIFELEHRSPDQKPWEAGVGEGWEGTLLSLDGVIRGVDTEALIALYMSGEIWPRLHAPWAALDEAP